MSPRPRATEQFLLAAKQSEMTSLAELADTCEVVTAVSELIHQLQRERGLSNVYLGSQGQRLADQRDAQIDHSRDQEKALRLLLQQRYLESRRHSPSTRVLTRTALVMQALDELDTLRQRITQQQVDARLSTQAFSRLMAGLLSIVFEAADGAGDPSTTRALLALFNFMQGKEYAGQERAWAAFGFTASQFNDDSRERLANLRFAQQRCFDQFLAFASDEQQWQWQSLEQADVVAQFLKLREVIDAFKDDDAIPADLGEVWYDLATQRIDLMHELERDLASYLLALSQAQLTKAKQQLRDHEYHLLSVLADHQDAYAEPPSLLLDLDAPLVPAGLAGSHSTESEPVIGRTLYDLLKAQAEHLREVSDELFETREALNERKLLERAKALLMKSLKLSEDEAYHRIQKRAMDSHMRVTEVCELLIEAAEQAGR
ncbi:nitrate- and nitrite sensing domain-containing protein [Saccharospirillum mangrovi]|uniref:nitrate- and nitrite sensing domain-containing protein n=1 Tax=Saccharospirillum mangrovi TaxID=2161747 RepID=UPI000D3AF754|nr:nitrate- and nitrite sensing domain-containing protein [Saccharospirillum mangrovi]